MSFCTLGGVMQASCPTAEEFVKDVPELCIEGGVDDGVHCTVDVAQPRHHTDQLRLDFAGDTEDVGDMNYKERSPAGQEHTCDMRWEVRAQRTLG